MNNRFLQLHVLVTHAPSNLNRDELGKPKTALFGGATRLRISSQCLKRAWRTSEVFKTNNIGFRTRNLKHLISEELIKTGLYTDEKEIDKLSGEFINKVYAGEKGVKHKAKTKNTETGEEKEYETRRDEIIYVSQSEIDNIVKCIQDGKKPSDIKQDDILNTKSEAVDIALFGRMVAKSPEYTLEAAVQVAHAITTHKVAIETDFFCAVEDLHQYDGGGGGAHLSEFDFGSGDFYKYICIDRHLLISNLNGDVEAANNALKSLIEAIVTVSPSGKQNACASLSRANYVLAELGNQQPRSLSMAFFNPITDGNLSDGSINALTEWRDNVDTVYGQVWEKNYEIRLMKKQGTLSGLKEFSVE